MTQQTLLIRIDDNDRAVLDRLASELGISRAAIIRRTLSVLRGSGIASDPATAIALKTLSASLLGVGRNLNQITRHLNGSGEIEAKRLGDVLSQIITLNAETRQMLSRLVDAGHVHMSAAISIGAASPGPRP